MSPNIKLTSYKASFDSDDKSEGDDTVTDVTFIGGVFDPINACDPEFMLKKLCILDTTIVLEVQMVDEHEWDEKAMLNIIAVEVDLENDEDAGAMNGPTTASAPALARIE